MADPSETDVKKGKELFLELLRLLPSSQVEDYYALGRWNDADLQLDFDLLDAHRKEAGAEDPPELEELEVPPMPDNKPAGAAWGATAYQRPLVAAGVGPGALPKPLPKAVTPIVQRAQPVTGLRPQQPKSAPPSSAMGAAGVAGGPSAELRQIALFIAKWKLEATKTKLLLARLTPPRRRWVMSNFAQAATGLSSTMQLEQYIARCERTNAWGAAGSSSPAVASKPVTGLKRPMTSALAYDPNKRPKVGISAAMPPRVGVAAGGIRPGITAYGRSATPAWLGAGAASVGRIPVGGGYRPQPAMPQRPTFGAGGYGAAGFGAARPGGFPKPAGMAARPAQYGVRPTAPKYGGGTIKPAVPKGGKAGGARPGSLIQNLLRM